MLAALGLLAGDYYEIMAMAVTVPPPLGLEACSAPGGFVAEGVDESAVADWAVGLPGAYSIAIIAALAMVQAAYKE